MVFDGAQDRDIGGSFCVRMRGRLSGVSKEEDPDDMT